MSNYIKHKRHFMQHVKTEKNYSDPTPAVETQTVRPDGGEAAESSIFNAIGDSVPYTNPDDLVGSKGIATYRKMYERDPEIASSHEEIIFGVVSQPWKISIKTQLDGSKKYVPQGVIDLRNEMCKFVEDNLNYLGGKTAKGLVYQPLQNLLYELALLPIRDGVGVWEKVWNQYDGKVWLDSLKSKPAEDYEFNADQFGNLTKLTFTVNGRTELEPSKFLLFPWLNVFQNWYGSSRYRRLYGCFWLDEICLRMAGTYAEKRAGGIWQGKYPKNDLAAKTMLLNVLRKAQASGVAVFPSDIEVDLDDAAKQGGDFFWNFHILLIKRIRRGMVGLETTAASGDTGDKAGQESRDKSVKQPLVSFASQLIAQVLNRQVVQPLIEYNWGEQDEYPEFEWDISDPIDSKSAAETAVLLSNIGVALPLKELEAKTGWRLTAEDGEEVVVRLNNSTPLPDGIRNPSDATGSTSTFAERAPKLSMSAKSVGRIWDAIDAEYQPLMLGYVTQIIEWGQAKLNSNYDKWKTQRSGINDLTIPYTGSLKTLFRRMAKAYYKAGNDVSKQQIQEASGYRGYSESAGGFTSPDDYATFQADFWWKSFTDGMKNTMTRTFAAGFEAGQSLGDMQASFQKEMTKYGPMKFTDKIGRDRPDWYEFNRQYRNAASSCYNTARWEQGQSARVVIGYRWVAVLDDRTRPEHRALDGAVFAKSDPRTATYKPPVDQCCRCTLDYVYDWEQVKWSDYPDWQPAPGFGGVK